MRSAATRSETKRVKARRSMRPRGDNSDSDSAPLPLEDRSCETPKRRSKRSVTAVASDKIRMQPARNSSARNSVPESEADPSGGDTILPFGDRGVERPRRRRARTETEAASESVFISSELERNSSAGNRVEADERDSSAGNPSEVIGAPQQRGPRPYWKRKLVRDWIINAQSLRRKERKKINKRKETKLERQHRYIREIKSGTATKYLRKQTRIRKGTDKKDSPRKIPRMMKGDALYIQRGEAESRYLKGPASFVKVRRHLEQKKKRSRA